MDKIFADGLMWKDPNENAPLFVKGSIYVNAQKFRAFMEANVQHLSQKGWFTIDMKEAKNGTIYFELNTWKPNKQKSELSQPQGTTYAKDLVNHTGTINPETGDEIGF